jgi:hypothetical protein
MTKAEIIEAICENVGGFSKREAAQLVDVDLQLDEGLVAAANAGHAVAVARHADIQQRAGRFTPGPGERAGGGLVQRGAAALGRGVAHDGAQVFAGHRTPCDAKKRLRHARIF